MFPFSYNFFQCLVSAYQAQPPVAKGVNYLSICGWMYLYLFLSVCATHKAGVNDASNAPSVVAAVSGT